MSHRTLLTIVGAVFAVLLVVMLVTYDYNKDNAEAKEKATQLIAAYDLAGLKTPMDADEIAKVLGDDGGAVCEAAGSDHQLGYLKTQLGVGGEFYQRPVTIEDDRFRGALLVVGIYCPDELQNVQDLVADLEFDDVVND